jgi:hypothetical protein
MVKKEKCRACRHSKQRVTAPLRGNLHLRPPLTFHQCIPEARTWNADVQQKCECCEKANRPCGPNEMPPDQPPRGRAIRALRNQNSGAVEQVEIHEQLSVGVENERSSISPSGTMLSGTPKEWIHLLDTLILRTHGLKPC